MRVQYNFEKNKTWRDYIDLSKYTGMEIEHGGNTANIHPMNGNSNLGHFDPTSRHQNNYQDFVKGSNKKYENIKANAGL